MTPWSAERIKDPAIFVAPIPPVLLFVVFGWSKLTNYFTIVGYIANVCTPTPSVAALVAIVIEVLHRARLLRMDAPAGSSARALYAGNGAHRAPLLDHGWRRPLRERDQLLQEHQRYWWVPPAPCHWWRQVFGGCSHWIDRPVVALMSQSQVPGPCRRPLLSRGPIGPTLSRRRGRDRVRRHGCSATQPPGVLVSAAA